MLIKNQDMKKYIYGLLGFSLLSFFLVSCEKFLEPGLDNRLTKEEMITDPAYYEGLLLHAYRNMPLLR